MQILFNPDLALPLSSEGNPPGWYQAMIPHQTVDLDCGVVREKDFSYVYLEQKGVRTNLNNNWAQNIENPVPGTLFRLEAEVAVENVSETTAFVGINFFGEDGRVLGFFRPPEAFELKGTTDWRELSAEGVFPVGCANASVRVGLGAGSGKIKARCVKLFLTGRSEAVSLQSQTHGQPEKQAHEQGRKQSGWEPGLELLVNGDFEDGSGDHTPHGWFRAMRSDLVIDHRAGIERVAGRGNVAFIEQCGTNTTVFNNWAQRLVVIPVGAQLRLTADVKTENLPTNTGAVMAQCWDTKVPPHGRLLSLSSTYGSQPIDGTSDWQTVTVDFAVPEGTDAIIVRCGMAESGKILFDSVSVKVVALAPAESPDSPELADRSLADLDRVNELSRDILRLAREKLGSTAGLRKEVHAKRGAKFEVVLYLDLQDPDD
jgi:hypothetical protein